MQPDSPKRSTYHPSGKVAPVAWLYSAFLAFLMLPVLAYAYAFLTIHTEDLLGDFFELTNPILAIALGYTTGRLTEGLIVRRGLVRHPRVALLLGAGSALWLLYLQWLFWVDMVLTENQTASLWSDWFSPGLLWNRIVEINATGTWVMYFKSDVPMPADGWFLGMIWLGEAVLVLLYPPYRCFRNACKPFSEASHRWHREVKLPVLQQHRELMQWLETLEATPETATADSKPADLGTVNRISVTLHHLDGEQGYITLESWSKTSAGVSNLVSYDPLEVSEQITRTMLQLNTRLREGETAPRRPSGSGER